MRQPHRAHQRLRAAPRVARAPAAATLAPASDRGRRADGPLESGSRTTVRLAPARLRTSAFSLISASSGSMPGRTSLSWTTTNGTRARLQISMNKRHVRLAATLDDGDLLPIGDRAPAHGTRAGASPSRSSPRRARPRVRTRARQRSASNSHRARKVSSTSMAAQTLDRRHAQLVATPRVDLLERADAEQARRVRREDIWFPPSASRRISAGAGTDAP